ncbi:MAG: hypothetical protein ACE5FC_02560, partial [Myxococcota bacterium]
MAERFLEHAGSLTRKLLIGDGANPHTDVGVGDRDALGPYDCHAAVGQTGDVWIVLAAGSVAVDVELRPGDVVGREAAQAYGRLRAVDP